MLAVTYSVKTNIHPQRAICVLIWVVTPAEGVHVKLLLTPSALGFDIQQRKTLELAISSNITAVLIISS